MAGLREGDQAPDFTLRDQGGREVTLNSFRGIRNVVLYFYPKDFTAGCTVETKAFGGQHGRIRELGAEILGVSSDDSESHRRFAEECNADFPLLSDPGGRVRKLYGVKASLGLVPGRVTFVIDREGKVIKIHSSQLNAKSHIEEAIRALSEPGRQ